ncbi:MAG: DUF1232 domain-containing protein [Leptolyngbyaceae cyanobacterium T60_A2020_046]|nr:DUF1232 domain-containing protein [Leptolyngbyaceae cyanobacterium T60_A2020_046]
MNWISRIVFDGYRRLLLHPRYGVWVLVASLAYLISPIDLSPDLLPLLGQIDDVALLILMATAASQWLSQRFSAQEEAASTAEPEAEAGQTIDVTAIAVDPDA